MCVQGCYIFLSLVCVQVNDDGDYWCSTHVPKKLKIAAAKAAAEKKAEKKED